MTIAPSSWNWANDRQQGGRVMKLAIKTCTLDMPYTDMLDFWVEQGVYAVELGAGNWSGAPHLDALLTRRPPAPAGTMSFAAGTSACVP